MTAKIEPFQVPKVNRILLFIVLKLLLKYPKTITIVAVRSTRVLYRSGLKRPGYVIMTGKTFFYQVEIVSIISKIRNNHEESDTSMFSIFGATVLHWHWNPKQNMRVSVAAL